MAESKKVKAADAENIDPIENINEEIVTPAVEKEEIAIEEPLDLYSTADDAAYITSTGEFNWDA